MSNNDGSVQIPPPGFILNSQVYGTLKWFVQIVMPATGVFYGTVGLAADIPKTDLVLVIWGALALLIGTVLGFSSRNFNSSDARFDGAVTVVKGTEAAAEYEGKKEVVLKVNRVDVLPGDAG